MHIDCNQSHDRCMQSRQRVLYRSHMPLASAALAIQAMLLNHCNQDMVPVVTAGLQQPASPRPVLHP
jgi:hypothetical protein